MSDEKQNPPSEKPLSREYDRTGFYPAEGKPFRVWAILGWNIAVIVVVAVIAAIINIMVLGAP